MVEAVRALRARLGIRQRDVALAISGHSVIIKKISLATLPSADELERQVAAEAERHIPFAIDEVEIDHELLGTRTSDGQIEVLLVAPRRRSCASTRRWPARRS